MTDPNSLTTESAATLNNRLLQRYTEAVDAETLRQFAADKRLSGLFIPAVSESYTRSKARLLIVGRETAGWRSHIDVSVNPDSANVAHYLQRQMLYHTEKVHNVSATSKFFQFYRHAARTVASPEDRTSQDAPVWANLFCVDANKTRPDNGAGPITAKIVALSAELLRIQIDVLRPQMIVFATGSSCDHYLKTFHRDPSANSKVHVPKRLWEFSVATGGDSGDPVRIRAFRTPHPRHTASNAIRNALVSEAITPGALEQHLASARL